MYDAEFLVMRDSINSLFLSQFTVFNNNFSVFDYMTSYNLHIKLERKIVFQTVKVQLKILLTVSGVANYTVKFSLCAK